jgi:cyanate permease
MLSVLWFLLFPEPLLAVQTHGAPEGLYAHQMGHAAFLAAMIYIWLRTRSRTGPGWRLIRLSFVFFALWNINTFLVHAIEASLSLSQFQGYSEGQAQFFVPRSGMDVYFYFGKMDHLLCAPATLLLGLGLRRLRRSDPMAGHGS